MSYEWTAACEAARRIGPLMEGLSGRIARLVGLVPDDPDAERVYRSLVEDLDDDLDEVEACLDVVRRGIQWTDDRLQR
ncbi:MAG: hypothetical protein OXI18_11760 [bacterium]|nr:hypothetical protein [bacterium]